jgi:hypothetical protein
MGRLMDAWSQTAEGMRHATPKSNQDTSQGRKRCATMGCGSASPAIVALEVHNVPRDTLS